MKLTAKTRRVANKGLTNISRVYHGTPGLALSAILVVLESVGLAFGLTFQPKTGTTRVVVTSGEAEVTNSVLVVQTHEMSSGLVELTTYLS